MFPIRRRSAAVSALLATSLVLSACSKVESEAKYPSGLERTMTGDDVYGEKESIFGDGGLQIFGGKKKKGDNGTDGIGVNSYLWRASLDTISFMPIASADPFGGVIITDWYTDTAIPNERVKLNVFILSRELKADGIRVRGFRQIQERGAWIDAQMTEDTTRKLEDSILARARELRVGQMAAEK